MTLITHFRVVPCSKCSKDTVYYCESCQCDMCSQCKENHVKDLKTMDHNVVIYREKFNYIPKQENCARYPNSVYRKYCVPCKVPLCYQCIKRRHKTVDLRTAYKTIRHQYRGIIQTIRSEVLFYRPVLLTEIKADFKTCQTQFCFYQSEMLAKGKQLKDFIDHVLCDFNLKHRCLKQKIEMNRHLASLQRYVNRYEQSALRPVEFLLSIRNNCLPQIHLKLHTSHLSMTESLNKEDVMELLSEIQITEKENRRVGNECLLKLMSGPELHQSLTVTGVDRCLHISCVKSDRIWVSDKKHNLVLTKTTDETLHHLIDLKRGFGLHTVNSENEVIYIGKDHNINKLSIDMKTTTKFIDKKDYPWEPLCLYWSPYTRDLLVGMYREKPWTGIVIRLNQTGQLTQTIQHDNTGFDLYREPSYITENNNGDVVVSDFDAVIVTECGGRHRFSYTGHPSGSGLKPYGICTDALSHILVCNLETNTVQMICKDGHFLSNLLIRPSGIFRPDSLSYDVNTHRLWVGSRDTNKVCVYIYITRQDALTDQKPYLSNAMESRNKIRTTEGKKTHVRNGCMLKLLSPPKFHQSLKMSGIQRCFHISCLTSDRVWVSDKHSIMLTNKKSDILHLLKDVCCGNGLHTVNSNGELIYIGRDYNINKLSRDMKATTIFIERTDYPWRTMCLYWSPSTRDLLVGMCTKYIWTGKVSRYNQAGVLTQTIQYNNTGLTLYKEPRYITENNDGDIVVSDFDAVVVTERGGRYRFSYTGPPSGSGLRPYGICADALSHILVCDVITNTVQILDKDGLFLSHIHIESQEMGRPWALCYDVNTHRLWVGSEYKMLIYRYTDRKDAVTDEPGHSPDGNTLSSSTPA